MKQKITTPKRRLLRNVAYAVLALLFVGLLAMQRHDLVRAIKSAKDVDLGWLVVGLGFMALSVVCTAVIYLLLTPRRLPFGQLMLVQTSGLFVNKLLPSGSGAAGVSYLYLRANKVKALMAAAIVLINNTLGFVGHALLLVLTLWLLGDDVTIPAALSDKLASYRLVLEVASAVLIVLIAVAVWAVLRRQSGKRSPKLKLVFDMLQRPQLLGALGISIVLTGCYLASLYAAAQSAGLNVSLPVALLVLTLSVGATAVVPVPGGIGAAEAGIYIALRAFDYDASNAILVAILYRLITFWVPLLVGAIAMIFVGKRRLLLAK